MGIRKFIAYGSGCYIVMVLLAAAGINIWVAWLLSVLVFIGLVLMGKEDER